eukprot:3208492-Prymnesium_polylepis.1
MGAEREARLGGGRTASLRLSLAGRCSFLRGIHRVRSVVSCPPAQRHRHWRCRDNTNQPPVA